VNKLYFGDNLEVMKIHVKEESIDLVYLDPPFKSDATYNVLYETESGAASEAQVEAFRDTWKWGDAAESAYEDVRRYNGEVALLLSTIRKWLGDNSMMAYLAMMAARLIYIRRVLKPEGSLYLHCDPTASHYLKLLLDATFGHEWFRNEIVWKRTNARSTVGQWPRLHDTILMYAPEIARFDPQRITADPGRLPHTLITGQDGNKYQTFELTGAGITKDGPSGQAWRGFNPTKLGRHWANSVTQREAWDLAGLIHWPKNGGWPRRLDERPFEPSARKVVVGDVWTDIDRLNQTAKERLGYPTQKPSALLERIILASSREGQTILDPFCGCGTTIEAAEKHNRAWVGIDVAHYAVTLIENRLKRNYPSALFAVQGRPTTLEGARDLARRDKHQFQWWAAWRLGSQTYRESKRGSDRGIDGNIFFANGPYGTGRIIVSVKGGENIGVKDVRDLRGVIEREDAELGVLVTLADPTSPMMTEAIAAGYLHKSAHGRLPRLQVATVADILNGVPPKLPPLPRPAYGPTSPPRRRDKEQLELLLQWTEDNIPRQHGDFVDPQFRHFGKSAANTLSTGG
jgi:DNA modification methylase